MPYGCPLSDDVGLVVAELAANAVLHGQVAGRDFELRLDYDGRGSVRVAVSDTRGDKAPPPVPGAVDPWSAEGGRGLLVVAAVAEEWGSRRGSPGRRCGRRSGRWGRARDDVSGAR